MPLRLSIVWLYLGVEICLSLELEMVCYICTFTVAALSVGSRSSSFPRAPL
jgi:hypothetical protein